MKELLFIHKIPIKNIGNQRAKEKIAEYIKLNKVELESASAINIYIPLRNMDAEASIECIYCGDIDKKKPIKIDEKKRSDIIINKLIADYEYDCSMNNLLETDFCTDLLTLKSSITAQISVAHFNDIIGILNPIGFRANPIGFSEYGSDNNIIIYYVENEIGSTVNKIISKTLTLDKYYEYLSAVYKTKIDSNS